ncbi:hypothetical protein [Thermosediminibacter litoriperuensis]|uniref:Uncharacterized protein n=1 Tax=Thermosediminibacter litoriperuensis TaxID=291989 RepID=A0A5S5ASQ8_9FIRM|nr:hypothetical protein [Thermosediminibacter litoriperuensis]TYP55455.1 hypothetical protein LZ11_01170 [Thermosediminibacter litoriperuensis]
MGNSHVIVYVDKTMVKITGVKVKGLKPFELELTLKNLIGRPVRVIGVTADSVEMDVYGLAPEAIYKNEEGIVKAVSTVSGITASDVMRIASAEKAVEVSIEEIPRGEYNGCARERWLKLDKQSHNNPDGG